MAVGSQVRTLEDLAAVLDSKREHERLEFKEAKSSFSLQKTIEYCVALANEGGGQMIFGVTDQVPRRVVGTQAFEDVNTLKKQVFDTLHFRVDVSELAHPGGRVLVMTVPSRPRGSPVHLGGRYFARVGESLVPMSPDQLRQIFAEDAPPVVSQAGRGGYLCGGRIRRVREDLRLKPSHLVDLIAFRSESAWKLAELDREEIRADELHALSELTGASLAWLKHGDEYPYEICPVDDFRWEQGLKPLAGVDPFDVRVAIDPSRMRCAVLHKRSEYRTDILMFTFNLDFWAWADDHGHIPGIWNCLRWLREKCEVRGGVILDRAAADQLFAGELHAGQFFDARRSDWFDDLFDLNQDIAHLRQDYKAYGAWFSKLQRAIRTWAFTIK